MFAALKSFLADLFSAFFMRPPPSPVAEQQQRRSFSADVVRADDLLVLTLDFYNVRLKPTATGREVIPDGPGDSFIVVHFPSQHIAEQAFFETNEKSLPGETDDFLMPPPVPARLAGVSKLVFHLNPALLPLEFSLEKILAALPQCAPIIRDRYGQPNTTPPIGGLAQFGGWFSHFSAIEAPWRLVLSPHQDGRWTHSSASVTHATRTELWHTRLGVRPSSGTDVDELSITRRTARAVYSPDYTGLAPSPPDTDLSPFRAALFRYHRHWLVRLSADRSLPGNAPVAIERMMLSSLGIILKLQGVWDTTVTDLVQWTHKATLGRDHFVKVVKKGFLLPLGNRAVEITITERKLDMSRGMPPLEGKPVAYLRQITFIELREPVKIFTHRAFPFRKVEFKTLKTPNLIPAAPPHLMPIASAGASTYWPRYREGAAEKDVLFTIEGTDWDGKVSRLSVPLIFVPFTADDGKDISKLVAVYNGDTVALPPGLTPEPDTSPRREISTNGQKIAFAPSMKSGDTSHDTDKFVFGAIDAVGLPHFLPAMRGARIQNPALRQISKGVSSVLVRYDKPYLDAAPTDFGNAGEVFLHIDAPGPAAQFPVEKTGGLVAPDFTPQGFSRKFGPVGDSKTFAGGNFDPTKIFAGIKILGGIELATIFKLIPFPGGPGQAGATVPGLTTTQAGNVIQTRYIWSAVSAQLQRQKGSGRPPPPPGTNPDLDDFFQPKSDAKFELDSLIETPLDGSPSRFSVSGTLEKFEIVLPTTGEPLIGALFDHVRFNAGSGRKMDVSVKFNDIVFKGSLGFVNDLRKYIPLDGFVDPPHIDVDANGINAGFTLRLPTIGVGIFTLQDVSLSAGFFLPFIGDSAALRFAFCERDHPFLLTVSLFGGGGFFALYLNSKEVISVEASLEFGAAIALNLGVAEGKASITAGVYYQKSGAGFEVTAFFRAAGSLSVLGIISISVELYIGLSYSSKGMGDHGGHLWGTASIKVKIKIVFFSISVGISITREFAGSDPPFKEMIGPGEWGAYCRAFAPEP
jgi:hypothetical protein